MDEYVPLQKTCNYCQRLLPLTSEYFFRDSTHRDGFRSLCKQCNRDPQRKHPEVRPGMKQCCRCKEWKPATPEYFCQKKRYKDGFSCHCKSCDVIEHKRYYQRSKEEAARRIEASIDPPQEKWCSGCRQWLASEHFYRSTTSKDCLSSICKHCCFEQCRRYKQENQVQIASYAHLYGQLNRERNRKRQQSYRRKFPLVHRTASQKRRARKLSSGGTYTAQQLQEQLKRQKNRCYWCHIKLGKNFHADHVIPLSRGGTNDISNIVASCAPCNLRKNGKLPHEWIEGGRLC